MWLRRLTVPALVAFLGLGASVAATPGAITHQFPAAPPAQVLPVLYPSTTFGIGLNAFRASYGRLPVRDNSNLALAAQRHANYLASRGILSHTGSGGSTMGQRARAAGCSYGALAENVARGYSTYSAVLAAWKNSSGHRANMLGSGFRVYGLGRSGSYWVLMLADRC